MATIANQRFTPLTRYATRRNLALALWLALFAITISLGIRTAGAYFRDTVNFTDFDPADREAVRSSLASVGITPTMWAVFSIGLELVQTLVITGVSALLVLKARGDWFAALVALVFLAQTQADFPPDIPIHYAHQAVWIFLARGVTLLAVGGLFSLPLLFPDGRLVSRWLLIPLAWVLFSVGSFVFWPSWKLATGTLATALNAATTLALVACAVFVQTYRYRHAASGVQRQQTKWVVFGLLLGLPAFFLGDQFMRMLQRGEGGILAAVALGIFMTLAFMAMPVTMAIAILRYRLYDIDLVIGRTVVWLAMSAIVVAGYAAIVLGIGSLLHLRDNLVLSIVATGLVAVAFQPARARLQRGVNRLLFGDRDDPYAVISRLGQRLEATLAPDEILPAIVRTMTEALRLPYAAIYLGGTTPVLAAAAGTPVAHAERFPLVYQSRNVGELVVAPRSPGEQFGPSDRRLLADLARQVGVAAHSVTLAADLQRSRERIVSAREEERRRLRRDLHDGLGAQLAALSIQAGALRTAIQRDPEAASEQASELRAELRAAVADIRRLVHGLRPPALDELGLVAALRERALRYGAGGVYTQGDQTREGDPALSVRFAAPDDFSPLPAAIEVALYRVLDEALANVARHARASACEVTLAIERDVALTIADDGVGIPAGYAPGVGLISMRERAEELGGTMIVGPDDAGRGTRLEIRLPYRTSGGTQA